MALRNKQAVTIQKSSATGGGARSS